MVAVSAPAISRLSAITASSYSATERMTRPLTHRNRWPNRNRRELLASDLASLINVIIGGTAADAIEVDGLLRGLEYKSSLPKEAVQEPHLGEHHWGALLEKLISGAPTPDSEKPVNLPDDALTSNSGDRMLPHGIEVCLNPPSIVLTWLGPNGAPKRLDFYGPATLDSNKRASPYGVAVNLVRKTFLSPEVIITAGDILRDASPQLTTSSAGPVSADTGEETAALPGRGSAAVPSDQPANTELDGSSQPRPTGEREKSQSSSGLLAGQPRRRKQGDPNDERP